MITENLWLPVQVLALGSILFSTVMAGSHPPSKAEPESEGLSPFQRVSVVSSEVTPRTSITSRVVILPVPDANVSRSGLSLEIETRQFRFERNAIAEFGKETESLRAPASHKKRQWRLTQIRRKQGVQWEGVPLIENDRREALGSAFVELDEGWNEFEVIFSDGLREVAYPVRVNHVRKSTT